MLPVLYLDPTIKPTAAVGAVPVLRNQSFEAELASCRCRCARPIWHGAWPGGSTASTSRRSSKARSGRTCSGMRAEVVAVGGQAVEGVELHLGIALAAVAPV